MSAAVPNVPNDPAPLSLVDCDRLFSPLDSFSNVALAVSGGVDSVALLVLFNEWRHRTGWAGRAAVYTVDHGLRAGSAADADFVAKLCRDLGIKCRSLSWQPTLPLANVQQEARLARYRLFADAAVSDGAECIVLAHHRDDQVETFLDRLGRGSGVYGLAGMALDEPNGPEGLRLIRPFLMIPKSALDASMRKRSQAWREDPTNSSAVYKRNRLRKILELLSAEGVDAARILSTATHMRRTRQALDHFLVRFLTEHVHEHDAGPVKLERGAYTAQPEELRLRFLAHIITRVTGRPANPQLVKLQNLDACLKNNPVCQTTLAGCVFSIKADALFIWREMGRTPPAVLCPAAHEGVWDCRYSYTIAEGASGLGGKIAIGPYASSPANSSDLSWPHGWPKSAFASAPVVWTQGDDQLLSYPSAVLPVKAGSQVEGILLERLKSMCPSGSNHVDEEDEPA
nr:tRNA lysidine(34) synthetase TilS [Roseibium denhamense]